MKNKKFFLLVFFLFLSVLLLSIPTINEQDYIVKPGDIFLIQAVSIDTMVVKTPVLPEGKISLHPIPKTISVNGKSLQETKEILKNEISAYFKKADIVIELYKPSSYRYHLHGAVVKPGEYFSSKPVTLYSVLYEQKQMLPKSNQKISIKRKNETSNYNIGEYINKGDLSQNPVILDEDQIFVNYMKDYISILINSENSSSFEYLEVTDSISVEKVIENLINKKPFYDPSSYSVLRNNEKFLVEDNFLLTKGDKLFLSTDPKYVFVTGNVENPGKFLFNSNKDVYYYIDSAGGINNETSTNNIYIVNKNGEKVKYEGQDIRVGDNIYLKQKFIYTLGSYISPFSVIFTSIITIYNLSK